MMLKILIYAYSQKMPSSRIIVRRCAEDVIFMWLAGMQKPDFRTISDFRKNNIKVLKKLFKQVVQICHRLGMVSLGLVVIDGTKVKAATGDYGARTKDALKEALKAVEADIENIWLRG
jgi:transposase